MNLKGSKKRISIKIHFYRSIYKYVSLNDNDTENEKRFQTLENKYIWCSSCTSYNDPFEFNVLYFDEEKMHQEGYSDKQIEYIKNFYNQQKKFYLFVVLAKVIITCLCGHIMQITTRDFV